MDYEYSGVLNSLYCEMCLEEVPNVKEAYMHKCFDNIDIQTLTIEGNIIRMNESAILSPNNEENESLEYLYEDSELFSKQSTFVTSVTDLPMKNRKCVSTNQVHQVLTENQPMLFSQDNSNDEYLDADREALKKNKKAHPVIRLIINVPQRNSDCAVRKQVQKVQDFWRRQIADVRESTHDIELDENGIAYSSEKNLIALIEMVRENPCLWNYLLPVGERNQYATSAAWIKIASYFPGWTPQIVRQQFSNLKATFIRRNVMARSGSASAKKKPWPYDTYFKFLKDTMSPGSTMSNVLPPKPKKSTVEEKVSENDDSQLEELGFEIKSDKEVVPQKKRKSMDHVERIILEKICNKEIRNSRPPLNQWDQWGLWLSKELQNFSDPTDRIEIQAYITTYIAKRKRDSKATLAEDFSYS